MDKGEANIDFVFRNGLKDYEVLPPNEVWDNINPVLKTKSRAFILFRAAALIAVLITLSFLAYTWTKEISNVIDSSVVSLNEKAPTPALFVSTDQPVYIKTKVKGNLESYQGTILENIADSSKNSEDYLVTSPLVPLPDQKNNLLKFDVALMNGLRTFLPDLSKKNSFKIEVPDLQYLPENVSVKSGSRWSIAAMASPTYYSNFSSGNSDISKQLATSEKPMISYSGGIAFTYKVSKRLSIQSGLYYSSLGQEIDGISSFGGFQKYDVTKGDPNFEVHTASGTVYTNNGDVFLIASGPVNKVKTAYTIDVFDPKKASLQYLNNSLRQNFNYLELPLVLRYKIIDKVIDFNLIGGISYNMLMNNSVFTIVDGAKYSIGKTEGLNPVSFSSSIGMGMEYNLSKKFSLNLEPTFRYYLNPFNQTMGSAVHPYSFGIFSGLSYKF